MTEWRETTLGDFSPLAYGKSLPEKRRNPNGDVPVFGSNGTVGLHDAALLEGPGIVIGRKGSVGEVHYAPGPYWPIDTTFYVGPDDRRDLSFTYYLLKHLGLQKLSGDSAVPGLNRDAAHRKRFSVPRYEVQVQIGTMLRSLDDLIENNRRRVEVLEQMAQAIYREWFVRFRYPGHEDTALVDSALGPIPEGWAVKTIGELSINHDRLRKPLAGAIRAQRTGSFPYYGAAKLIDWIDGWIFDGEFLLFAEDGTVQTSDGFPVLQLVEGKFWANNHTHILQGKNVSTRFLFLASGFQPIVAFVTGAAQPKVTQANLNRLPLVVGPTPVMEAFDEVVDPIFDEWNLVKAVIPRLEGIRDLLLPKLVTGQIDVSDLDLDAAVESVA
jgi:type I restriction enzyme, S subunit